MADEFDIQPEYCNKCKQLVAKLIYKFDRIDGGIDVLTECEACGHETREIITKEMIRLSEEQNKNSEFDEFDIPF